MDKIPLGSQVRLARRAAGHQTVYSLSKACGVSCPVISDIETGKSSPSVSTLKRIFEPIGWEVVIGFRAPAKSQAAYMARQARATARRAAHQQLKQDGVESVEVQTALATVAQEAVRTATRAEAANQRYAAREAAKQEQERHEAALRLAEAHLAETSGPIDRGRVIDID